MPASGDRSSGSLPSARLRELGIELPDAPAPLGAYVPAVEAGPFLFLSGMLPLAHGKLAFTGRFGADINVALGRDAARLAALNALSVVSHSRPGLDRVAGVVRLGIAMATTVDFVHHAAVADGASELFAQIFGKDPGHTRLIAGVQSLNLGSPLAIEAIFRIEESVREAPLQMNP